MKRLSFRPRPLDINKKLSIVTSRQELDGDEFVRGANSSSSPAVKDAEAAEAVGFLGFVLCVLTVCVEVLVVFAVGLLRFDSWIAVAGDWNPGVELLVILPNSCPCGWVSDRSLSLSFVLDGRIRS